VTEAAGSPVTSIYVYIYQTVQNHTPDDIFLVVALRISDTTVLQHVRDYPFHTAFNILFLAAPRSWSDKTYTEFSSPETLQRSPFFCRYTHSDLHFRCLNIDITHYEVGWVILKVKKRLASIQKVFYSYLDSKPDYDAKLMWAPYIKRPTVEY